MNECWERTWSNEKSRYYYTNIETGKSQWGLPLDKSNKLPKGWEIHESRSQKRRVYYGYTKNQITQWDAPKFVRDDEVQLPPGWEEAISKCGNKYYVNTDRRISIWADDVMRVESELRPKSVPKSIPKSVPKSPIKDPIGLNWIGNSCYLDSTLFAFLAGPKSFIHNFLNINIRKDLISEDMKRVCYGDEDGDEYGLENRRALQRELKRIDDSMRGGPYVKNCTALRATLKNCRGESNQVDPFWNDGSADPEELSELNSKDGTAESGEFLAHLLRIIPHDKAIKKTTTYVTNNLSIEKFNHEDIKKSLNDGTMFKSSEFTDHNASIIHVIHAFTLLDLPDPIGGTNIISLLDLIQDDGQRLDSDIRLNFRGKIFKRRVIIEKIVKTPYLIVSLKRVFADEYIQVGAAGLRVIRTPIYPNELIYIGDEPFTISGIVMNTSAVHYTAIAKYGDFWYYYNDSPRARIKKYTTFEEVINACVNTKGMINPITNGTQYYYKPLIER
jgi:hypothetical protein